MKSLKSLMKECFSWVVDMIVMGGSDELQCFLCYF